jgi:hypothetical protein
VISSDQPMKVQAYQLERHDVLDASNPRKIRFEHNMYKSYLDGFDLVLPAGAKATLTLQHGGPLLAGKSAKKVGSPYLLEAGAAPTPPPGNDPPPTPPGNDPPPTTTGKCKKWYPGHYSSGNLGSVQGKPGYIGYRKSISWSNIEPQKDVYSGIPSIRADLDAAQKAGKKVSLLLVIIGQGGHGGAPAYISSMGGTYTTVDTGGGNNVTKKFTKLYQKDVSDRFVKLLAELGQKLDSHPALAHLQITEPFAYPNAPGFSQEQLFANFKKWSDTLSTSFKQTPTSFMMNWGMAKYRNEAAKYVAHVARIGFGNPDMGFGQDNAGSGVKGPGCRWVDGTGKAGNKQQTYHFVYSMYRGATYFAMMVSQPSSQCLASPQEAVQQANRMGIHFLTWVGSPKNWSRSQQDAYLNSLASKPNGGLTTPAPSNVTPCH